MADAMVEVGAVVDRESPAAASRATIVRIVFEELARVRPSQASGVLAENSSLTSCGIDDARFLDAVHRLEGRYGMRFRQ